ncbi:hypothetical protein RHGRI_028714 [Rhododendron griersonianum]|uniref:Uncharacterized protein n=1 Tax=Rhododendron griersonianum TaxID=479676 RepID=A0AAV6IIT4_9ERIC|nr:hypothetical protein RHGRI_028714 [Rhododendron griersonianum]
MMDELRQGDKDSIIPNYVHPDFFSIKVHHGGVFFAERGRKSYFGGKVSYSDYENRKIFSDNVVDIFLVIPNTILDDLLDVDVGNWEWESETFPESGVTIDDVDMIEGLGGSLADDDSDSDANYDYFHDSDYDLSDEDDRIY